MVQNLLLYKAKRLGIKPVVKLKQQVHLWRAQILLGPVGLVGGAFIKGKNIEYPAGATVYVQPQDSVTIQGLVIGGDGLAHSDDELADAVTVPNTTGESEEYVENNDTDENAAVAEDATAVEEPEEPCRKCFSTYRCCKA